MNGVGPSFQGHTSATGQPTGQQEGSVSSIHLRRAVAVVTGAMLAVMLIGPATVTAARSRAGSRHQLAKRPARRRESGLRATGTHSRIHNGGTTQHLAAVPRPIPSRRRRRTSIERRRRTVVPAEPRARSTALRRAERRRHHRCVVAPIRPRPRERRFDGDHSSFNSNGATFSDRGNNSHGDADRRRGLDRAQCRQELRAADSTSTATDVVEDDQTVSKQEPAGEHGHATGQQDRGRRSRTAIVSVGGTGTDPCGTSVCPTARLTGRGST